MNNAGRILPMPKGEYNSEITYEYLDFVTHDGSSYIAKKQTVGNLPSENSEYWQLMARKGSSNGTVTGIKGEAETEYREGNVNLTKQDIGLGNVENLAANDLTIDFTENETREEITGNEKLSVLFSKVKKWFKDLKPVCFSGSYSDLTDKPLNSKESDGFVKKAGEENSNKVWATDEEGNPDWRENNNLELLTTIEEVEANTQSGYAVDALVISSLNNNFTNSINKINSGLVNLVTTRAFSTPITIPAQYKFLRFTVNISLEGYYPLGFASIAFSDYAYTMIGEHQISGNTAYLTVHSTYPYDLGTNAVILIFYIRI